MEEVGLTLFHGLRPLSELGPPLERSSLLDPPAATFVPLGFRWAPRECHDRSRLGLELPAACRPWDAGRQRLPRARTGLPLLGQYVVLYKYRAQSDEGDPSLSGGNELASARCRARPQG